MRRRGLSKISLAIGFVVIASLSIGLIGRSMASDSGLSLPLEPVTIEVSDGAESFFDTELSNVPSGYDVMNRLYLGWCVDVRTEMARSPATHEVKLYSSLAAPGELAGESWDMINYILNHKQGVVLDIQQAIWYFMHMDGEYTPTREVAWVVINDALANGDGFVPGNGQIVAVICYPMIMFPSQPDVQISVIELAVTVIPEFPSVFVLSLIMLAMLVAVLVYRMKAGRLWRSPPKSSG